jgi:hypothetical protein
MSKSNMQALTIVAIMSLVSPAVAQDFTATAGGHWK